MARITAILVTPLAHVLIAVLWGIGDKLFDWFVTADRALVLRNKTQLRWTIQNRTNDDWQPTTKLGKTWKENRRNALNAAGVYMDFVPYQTLAERAERLVNAGGPHVP